MARTAEGMSISQRQGDDDHRVLVRPLFGVTQAHVEFELLARVASRYYLQDRTQAEIAEEFGLSRQKVQRLIRRARDQGIVEIHVHSVPVLHIELENKLRATFGLQDAVVATSHPDEVLCRRLVARAAADYLERHLADGDVVAVGLGRNTSMVASLFNPPRPPDVTFVSAMGGSPGFGASINPNEVCATFAAGSGGRAQALYAPAFVEDARLRDSLLGQQAVSQTLDLARESTHAVVGIGTPSDDSILVKAGCLSKDQACALRSAGAVGEIIGNYCDIEGRPIHSIVQDRFIGLTLEELRNIPLVIAVAAEPEKGAAILGALRSGAVHVLVTECRNALEVLRLAGVTDLEEETSLLREAT
jgi:DNA-binding transcriptional regulator LsrR (DeoR family)